MKKFPTSLLLAALVVIPLHAAPPTMPSIDQLLEAAKVEKALDMMTSNLDQTIRRNVEQAVPEDKLTADDKKTLDAFRVKMTALISDELSWVKIKAIYEQVYATTFTQEQVDDLIAFYQGPVGQMFAEKQPEITQQTALLMQQKMIPLIAKLRSAANDTVEQIQSAHTATPDSGENPSGASAVPKTN